MRFHRWIIWLLAFSLGLNVVLMVSGSGRLRGSLAAAEPETATAPASMDDKPAAERDRDRDRDRDRELFDLDDAELGLSAEQKKKILEIRRRMDVEDYQLRLDAAERMESLSRILAREDVTSGTLEPHLAAMSDRSESYMRRLARAIREQRTVLTPEQNEVLTRRLKKRFEEMEAWSERHLRRSRERLVEKYGTGIIEPTLDAQTGTTTSTAAAPRR